MNVLLNILFGGGLTVLVVANVLQVVEVVKSGAALLPWMEAGLGGGTAWG